MRIFATAILLLCLLAACKKESTPVSQPTRLDLSRITETDATGMQNGTIDPTDWRFDGQWNSDETALMNFGDSVQRTGMQRAGVAAVMAYPNPAVDRISFAFGFSQPTLVRMAIVDSAMRPITRFLRRVETGNGNGFQFAFLLDLQQQRFQYTRFFRMYYALYDEAGVVYKRGHGDFHRR